MKKKLGKRFNKNKLRWRNFPLWLIEGLIAVGAEGEKKYGTFNFLKGQYVNDLLDSLKRHLVELEHPNRSDYDKESKQLHSFHIAWNALVLSFILETRPDLDDRWKGRKNENKKR
jgi:hypothetical protein